MTGDQGWTAGGRYLLYDLAWVPRQVADVNGWLLLLVTTHNMGDAVRDAIGADYIITLT